MMRWACLAVLALGLTRCDSTEPAATESAATEPATVAVVPNAAAPAESARENEAADSDLLGSGHVSSIDMEQFNMYLHEDAPTDETAQEPTLWLHADQGQRLENAPLWTLTNAKAVIYRDDTEDITLEAGKGTLDETTNVAELFDGVLIYTAMMRIETERVAWDNERQRVESRTPLSMKYGESELEADGFAMAPDEKTLVLNGARGTISLKGTSL